MGTKKTLLLVAFAMLFAACNKEDSNTIDASEIRNQISNNVNLGNNLLLNIYNYEDDYNYANYYYNNDGSLDEFWASTMSETIFIGKFNYSGNKTKISVVEDIYDEEDTDISTIKVLPEFNSNGFLSKITIEEKIVEEYHGEKITATISDNYSLSYNSNKNLVAIVEKYKISGSYMGVTQNETITINTNINWENGCAVSSTSEATNGKYKTKRTATLTYNGQNPLYQNTFALNEICNIYYLTELQMVGLIGKGTSKLPMKYSYKTTGIDESGPLNESNSYDWDIELNDDNTVAYELDYEFDYARATNNLTPTKKLSAKKKLPTKQLQEKLRNQAKINVYNKLINKEN
ncbi:MAG: hypothetical protein MJ069_02370 [Salinivirgaceae bacterium]|nr:hypothetical protein [Salinivirgaceae bacterium]